MPARAEKNTIVQEKKMNKNGRFPLFAALMNLAPIALPILCGVSFFHPGPSEFAAGPLEGDLSMDIIWSPTRLGVRVACGFLGDGGGERCDEEGPLPFSAAEYDPDAVLEVRAGPWGGGRWVWSDMARNGRSRGWRDGDL